jgi:tetratricopeptide (TPR) repeat protein
MSLFGRSYHELCEKGKSAFDSGDLTKALDAFTKAVDKDPQHPRAFGWLGMVYMSISQHFTMIERDEAKAIHTGELSVRAFDEAINLETERKDKAMLYYQRGLMLANLRRPDERDRSWSKADDLVPGFVETTRTSTINDVIANLKNSSGKR